MTYGERLQALELPTLAFRRKRNDLLQTYKIIHNLNDLNQETRCHCGSNPLMFETSLSQNTRGHSHKLQVKAATGPRKNFYATRVVPLWNSLSESTVCARTVNEFKTGLKKDLQSVDRYSYDF